LGRPCQEQRRRQHHDALNNSPHDEGVLVIRRFEHVRYRRDRRGSAYTERACGKPDAKTAMIWKPFQRVPNGAAIDDSGTDTAHAVPEVKAIDGLSPTRSDPSQS